MKVLLILSTVFVLKAFTQECGPLQQKSCDEFANKHKMSICEKDYCCFSGHIEVDDEGEFYVCDTNCIDDTVKACNSFLNSHGKIGFCGYSYLPKAHCELK